MVKNSIRYGCKRCSNLALAAERKKPRPLKSPLGIKGHIKSHIFKKEAQKHNTQYQKMIRRLLDEYTANQ